MKDNDLRGLVLKRFYDLRHEQIDIQFHDVLLPGEGMERVTSNICRQLSDHGLIDWQNHNSLDETSFGGIGYITANGVDVIEGHSRPPIAITVHDQAWLCMGQAMCKSATRMSYMQTLASAKFILRSTSRIHLRRKKRKPNHFGKKSLITPLLPL
jgi:hypothetical protein